MADRKITALAAVADHLEVVGTDIVAIVDDPGGTPVSKRCSIDNLVQKGIGEIHVANGVGSQALSAATWTKINQFTTAIATTGITASAASDTLVGDWTAHYRFGAAITFEVDVLTEVEIALVKTGPTRVAFARMYAPTVNRPFHLSLDHVELTGSSDTWEIQVQADDAVTFKLIHGQFSMTKAS